MRLGVDKSIINSKRIVASKALNQLLGHGVFGSTADLVIFHSQQHKFILTELGLVTFLVVDQLEYFSDLPVNVHFKGQFLQLKMIRKVNFDLFKSLCFEFLLHLLV